MKSEDIPIPCREHTSYRASCEECRKTWLRILKERESSEGGVDGRKEYACECGRKLSLITSNSYVDNLRERIKVLEVVRDAAEIYASISSDARAENQRMNLRNMLNALQAARSGE